MQPFLQRTADSLPHVPLWNPSIVAGRPFQANSQSAVFSIYNLPAYVLPFWTALGWIGVMKLWVAAFGTYLLARRLGMGFAAALLAGLVFALNLKMVTWLSYPAMGVWTFLPWLLLTTERVVRRPGVLSACALAVVVALQFLAGHAESSFHVLLGAAAFLVLRLWMARRSAEPASGPARPLLLFAGAIVGGAALAAVSLIPFTELLLSSADIVDRRGASVDLHFPAKDVLGLFLPDYWGRPTQTPLRPLLLERAMYAGALPLMLAAAALILRPTVERVAVAAVRRVLARRALRGAAVHADRDAAAPVQLGAQHAADRAAPVRRRAAGGLGARRAARGTGGASGAAPGHAGRGCRPARPPGRRRARRG